MNDVSRPHTSLDKTARLLELRALKEKREAREKESDDARELEELELEEKHSSKGRRGVDYDIVNTAKGLFVLRKPDWTVAKKYNSIPAREQTDEDVWNYVLPHIVEPDAGVVKALMLEHGGIAHRCAIALHNMYGANGPEGRSGKF